MKRAASLALLIFCATAAAQPPAQKTVAQIEALLPAETLAMARSEVLTGRFAQTRTLKDLAQPLRSSGRFTYARAHGVLWGIEQPFAAEFVLAGGRLIARHKGDEPAFSPEMARLLTALFTLDLPMLQRSFRLEVERDASRWSLRLLPRHRVLSSVLSEIRLEGRRHLQSVRILDTSGNVTRIDLKDLRVLKAVPAETLAKFQ